MRPRRATLTGVVSAVAAVAIALAVYGRGCSSDDESAEATARLFLAAALAGERGTMFELMSQATQNELVKAARLATERVGGARRFEPLDMIRASATTDTERFPELKAVEQNDARVVFEVTSDDGRSAETLVLVQERGRWKVDVPTFRAEH